MVRNISVSFSTERPSNKIGVLLPTLATMIQSPDKVVLERICSAYSYFMKVANGDQIKAFVDSGVLTRLVELLQDGPFKKTKSILKIVNQIVTKDFKCIDKLLDANIIPKLINLLNDEDKEYVGRALSAIEDLMCGDQQQIQRILNSDIMEEMDKCMRRDILNEQIKSSWAEAMSKFFRKASKEQITKTLKRYKIVKPYCEAVSSEVCSTVLAVLEGMEALLSLAGSDFLCIMLKDNDVIVKLKSLQNHQNGKVSSKAFSIMETYFNEIEEKDDEAPEAKRTKIYRSMITFPIPKNPRIFKRNKKSEV